MRSITSKCTGSFHLKNTTASSRGRQTYALAVPTRISFLSHRRTSNRPGLGIGVWLHMMSASVDIALSSHSNNPVELLSAAKAIKHSFLAWTKCSFCLDYMFTRTYTWTGTVLFWSALPHPFQSISAKTPDEDSSQSFEKCGKFHFTRR